MGHIHFDQQFPCFECSSLAEFKDRTFTERYPELAINRGPAPRLVLPESKKSHIIDVQELRINLADKISLPPTARPQQPDADALKKNLAEKFAGLLPPKRKIIF